MACVVGDGGFLMMVGEMTTAKRLGVSVVFVLLTDHSLELIRIKQERKSCEIYGIPLRFYQNVSPALLVAASTTSSAATLPVSMEVAEKNVGAPEKVWGFALPLGATVNMNGMAACIGVIAVFSCNLYHVPITLGGVLQFLFLGLALSLGTAGVKGVGIVMSTILLQSIGLPTAIIVPILASIWPVLDVGNTCCNVSADLVGTTLVASRFGMLDREVFESGNLREKNGEITP